VKAVIYTKYGSPDVLEFKDVAQPEPKDNEVLVKIYATTVSPVDCTFRKGSPFIARLYTGFIRPKNSILGTELAGKIETVGKDVTRFQPGDKIFASTDGHGAYGAYVCLPEDGVLAKIPANMTYDEAAAICNGALTALPFLRDEGRIHSGQKVLINGASGSIGTFAVQLAKNFGADVTGVCSGANVEMVTSLGANRVIDYTKADFTNGGEAFDIIFDTVGKSSFSRCKGVLTLNGVYLSPVLTLGTLLQMVWTSIIGSKKAKFAATGMRTPGDQAQDLTFLTHLLEQGKIKPIIDRRYPLTEIAEAHRYVDQGHKKGNVVITMKHDDNT